MVFDLYDLFAAFVLGVNVALFFAAMCMRWRLVAWFAFFWALISASLLLIKYPGLLP